MKHDHFHLAGNLIETIAFEYLLFNQCNPPFITATMRLINTETLKIQEFSQDIESFDFPSYAILSHRWRQDEISYKEFVKGRNKSALGYLKISQCCQFARSRECGWVWVDTW